MLAQSYQAARNVYRCRRRVRGRIAYYAITSCGELLGGYIRVVGQGETEARVVAELWTALCAADPVHLRIVDAPAPTRLSPAVLARLLRQPSTRARSRPA